MSRRVVLLALGLFALLAFWPGVASLPAIDRDEARFAQASRQMLESHDFIDIRFQDTPRYKKPIAIYWLQAATTAALGESAANPIFTYRLPSLLAAVGSVLLTFLIGLRLFGDRGKALLAGAFMAASPLLGAEARLAKTDAMLLLAILAAMLALWEIFTPPKPERKWFFLFWIALGFGVLVKGPVILLVCGLAVVALRSRALVARLRPLPGIALLAAICLPWLIAITLASNGAFWREAVGHDMLAKAAGGQESHGAPPGTYLLLLPFFLWPAALPLGWGLADIWKRRREDAFRFLLAWAVPAWVVFELIPTKLIHYVLFAYPALAILAACAVPSGSRKWNATWLFIWSGFGLLLAGLAGGISLYFDHVLSIPGLIGSGVIVAAILATHIMFWRGRNIPHLGISAGSALALALLFGAVMPSLQSPFVSRRLREATRDLSPPMSRMILVGYHEPSAVLAMGTNTLLAISPGAAAEALAADPLAVAAIDEHDAGDFAALSPSARETGSVPGFNYAKGEAVRLILFRGAAP